MNETLEIEIIDSGETSNEDSTVRPNEDFNSEAVVPVAIIMVVCLCAGFATGINYMR